MKYRFASLTSPAWCSRMVHSPWNPHPSVLSPQVSTSSLTAPPNGDMRTRAVGTWSGWQTSWTDARRFEFTTEERSYAQAAPVVERIPGDQPAQTMNVRYEHRPQLVRLGILPTLTTDPLRRRERARGFDAGFSPEPPREQ